MSKRQTEILGSMKQGLLARVEEWLGMDIPDEGTEDYETWQSKLSGIGGIESIDDVIEYLEGEGCDVEDFFLCGEYDVISAGLDPSEVSLAIIEAQGQLVAEQATSGRSKASVYLFDGTYFVIAERKVTVAQDERSALKIAGIKDAR